MPCEARATGTGERASQCEAAGAGHDDGTEDAAEAHTHLVQEEAAAEREQAVGKARDEISRCARQQRECRRHAPAARVQAANTCRWTCVRIGRVGIDEPRHQSAGQPNNERVPLVEGTARTRPVAVHHPDETRPAHASPARLTDSASN
eukprot:3850793-Prymnesium_polylepis.1